MHASWKVMDSKIEQRIVIKFLINSGEKLAKIFLKLKKVFLNECASRAHVFEWARHDEQLGVPARMQRSQMKVLLVCFFDVHRIVHHEFVPPHQTVTVKFYLEVLARLQARIKWVRIMAMHRHIHLSWYTNTWREKIFPCCHTHPTLQPDLIPCNFFLFMKFKSALKGMRFDDLEEI